jgi:hypothetical protein
MLAQVQKLMRQVSQQVNAITEGKARRYNASTVAPADGTGNPGDFVAKANIVASGPVGAQYVLIGWRCVSTGASTQWMEVLENVRARRLRPLPRRLLRPLRRPVAPRPTARRSRPRTPRCTGSAVVTTIPGYEGTGHADWFRSGFDEYLEFSFTGPTCASGDLTLRYANYGATRPSRSAQRATTARCTRSPTRAGRGRTR